MAGTGQATVNTQEIRSTAQALLDSSNNIKDCTNQMMDIIQNLSGAVWSGQAQTQYVNKFKGLQDDIAQMDRMIKEHATDLQTIAKNYEDAEQRNIDTAQSLDDNPIV